MARKKVQLRMDLHSNNPSLQAGDNDLNIHQRPNNPSLQAGDRDNMHTPPSNPCLQAGDKDNMHTPTNNSSHQVRAQHRHFHTPTDNPCLQAGAEYRNIYTSTNNPSLQAGVQHINNNRALALWTKLYCIARTVWILAIVLLITFTSFAQQNNPAPKPLYTDPIHDGAADPVIIWNSKANRWWMFYTNRRANIQDTTGVKWVHGTKIGIAESTDGRIWKYKDTTNINYRPDVDYTFWAPDVIEFAGNYHMYLTYVPGIFSNWNHPRNIVHLTSKDLVNWKFESQLKLVNNKVIDASVFQLPDGSWRLWYNNEMDGKSIWYADSKDLYNWVDKGKAIAARGEGPKVFRWKESYWMIVDVWKGMEIYQSNDLLNWKKQATRILEEGGTGKDDGAIGGHCDVVVNNDRVYVYYFTHPGRTKADPAPSNSYEAKRSVIQVVELEWLNGELICDRNKVFYIQLSPPKK